jgi:hypothetical protein
MSAEDRMPPGDEPADKPNGVLEMAVDRTARLVKSLPARLRAIVIIFVITLAAILLYRYYSHASSTGEIPKISITANPSTVVNPSIATNPSFANYITIQNGPAPSETGSVSHGLPGAPHSIASSEKSGQYVGGQADPNHPGADNNNPQNLEAAHKGSEDLAAVMWHFTNLALDNPPEVQITPDVDANNYLRYRYYGKSDNCVFIDRREKGIDTRQWVRDPAYHLHDIDSSSKPEALHSDPMNAASSANKFMFALLDRLMPHVLASDGLSGQLPVEPVQGGPQYCINPHPGTFKYWWGPPIDQCNSPMYRQFSDGCTHYQVYNRCANSWDVRIFWTYCHPPPHG